LEANENYRIVEVELSKLKPYKKAMSRKHDVDKIIRSIKRYGYRDLIEVDEKYWIQQGHGRLKALTQLDYEKIKVQVNLGMSAEAGKVYREGANRIAAMAKKDKRKIGEEVDKLLDKKEHYEIADMFLMDDTQIDYYHNSLLAKEHDVKKAGQQKKCPHCASTEVEKL